MLTNIFQQCLERRETHAPNSGQVEPLLEPSDILSRFLLYKQLLTNDMTSVRSSLYGGKHDFGFSVFRTTDQSEEVIWQMFYDHVDKPGGRDLIGRADLETEVYWEANLEVAADQPPPKHYNVIGMPVPDGNLIVAGKKLAARQYMVSRTRLILFPLQEN